MLKKAASAKGLLVILLAVFIGIFVWRNFNFLTEITFSIKNPVQAAAIQPTKEIKRSNFTPYPELGIGKVLLPPAPKDLPSIMVFEINNPGTGETKNIRVSLDLGSSKVIGFEIIGANNSESKQPVLGTSMLTTTIDKIGPAEHAYLYIHCSEPVFRKLTVSSPDVFNSVEKTYNDANSNSGSDNNLNFNTFLYIVFGFFIVVMTLYFTFLLIGFLNKYVWPKS